MKYLITVIGVLIGIFATIYYVNNIDGVSDRTYPESREDGEVERTKYNVQSEKANLNSFKQHEETKMAEEIRRGYKIEIYSQTPSIGAEIAPLSAPEVGSPEPSETLIVDGNKVPFLKTEEGYRIYYNPPHNSLLEAARSYIDTQREK